MAWKYSDILIWPNWWPGVTRIEMLSSYNPISGFQGGTVRHTAVTKMKKIWHGLCHYSSYTLWPICEQLLKRVRKTLLLLQKIQQEIFVFILFCLNIFQTIFPASNTYFCICKINFFQNLPLHWVSASRASTRNYRTVKDLVKIPSEMTKRFIAHKNYLKMFHLTTKWYKDRELTHD